jgi:L-amino acid N-acyltransferase YncA
MIEVRLATSEDAAGILAIYAPHVLSGICTFETELPTTEQIAQRIDNCLPRFPWIVCSIDGQIAAYVYASKHREREAYQWSCECSVYVHNDFAGKRIGEELYRSLIEILSMQGFRNLYAGITLPNDPSIRLHEKCGFAHFATYENIGYKLGRWHNVGWWKLRLNDCIPDPPPPLKLSELKPETLRQLFNQSARNIQSKFID